MNPLPVMMFGLRLELATQLHEGLQLSLPPVLCNIRRQATQQQEEKIIEIPDIPFAHTTDPRPFSGLDLDQVPPLQKTEGFTQ